QLETFLVMDSDGRPTIAAAAAAAVGECLRGVDGSVIDQIIVWRSTG
ncbi:hypothetical protein GBF38_008392, partial [Nibea albiflora]